MGSLVVLSDVPDADFLLLLFFEALSSSTLLNVSAVILLVGRVEISGVKILFKVS